MSSQWPARRAVAYTAAFPIYGVGITPQTGVLGLDSEISKDGGAFADCTNEATEIGTSGNYTLILTALEMTADRIVVQVKSSTMGTVVIVIDTIDLDDIDTVIPLAADVAIAVG